MPTVVDMTDCDGRHPPEGAERQGHDTGRARPARRPFRGLLGVHSRYGLYTRAVTIFRDTHSEGFSYFVTSIAAPAASGWSVRRVGLAPTGKRRLVTAHTRSGHLQPILVCVS